MKEAKIYADGGKVRVAISCEIDHHSAKAIREAVDEAIERHRPSLLVLDFSAVRFMDSSGIGLIIGRADKARAQGCTVRAVGLESGLKRLALLSGVLKLSNLEIE